MYRALNLSQYIVSKCIVEGQPISNLQLQKILYYIQREFLRKVQRAAFSDSIEAWQFGPVVPEVYYYYCGNGSMPIYMTFENFELYSEDKSIVDPIVETLRVLDPWDLVNKTHKIGGAWDQIYQNGRGFRHTIPLELIQEAG